jgi:hypothetical protein
MLQFLTPRKFHTKSNQQACPAARPHHLRPPARNRRLQRLSYLSVSTIPIPFNLHAHASRPIACPVLSDQAPFVVIQNP